MKLDKNTKFVIAIILGVIALIISIELPYSDKAIIQILIPFIQFQSIDASLFETFIPGIIPLVGLVISLIYVLKSKNTETKRIKVFVILFIILAPLTFNNLNFVKAPIYYFSEGAKAVEIIDSSLSSSQIKEDKYIQVSVELKNYKEKADGFQLAVKLSDSASDYVETNYIVFEDEIWLSKNQTVYITEKINIRNVEYSSEYSSALYELFSSDYSITIFDDSSKVENIRNDSY